MCKLSLLYFTHHWCHLEVYYDAKHCIKWVLENIAKVLEFFLTNLWEPCRNGVYDCDQLAEVNKSPRIKLSEDVEKVTMPGRKVAYRLYSADGHALVDLLQQPDEPPVMTGTRVLCRHPFQVFFPIQVQSVGLAWCFFTGLGLGLNFFRWSFGGISCHTIIHFLVNIMFC